MTQKQFQDYAYRKARSSGLNIQTASACVDHLLAKVCPENPPPRRHLLSLSNPIRVRLLIEEEIQSHVNS